MQLIQLMYIIIILAVYANKDGYIRGESEIAR